MSGNAKVSTFEFQVTGWQPVTTEAQAAALEAYLTRILKQSLHVAQCVRVGQSGMVRQESSRGQTLPSCFRDGVSIRQVSTRQILRMDLWTGGPTQST